jgi:hypothetical protein
VNVAKLFPMGFAVSKPFQVPRSAACAKDNARSILWSENRGKYSMYGIDFPRAFGLASANIKKISVGKWLRSIERGFAQAENNHFKPLIRGVPEPWIMSQIGRQFCLSECKRSMASKCLGQE